MSSEEENENFDEDDQYELENETLPTKFYHQKWPHPKLIHNRPTGKDEALCWFLDFYREQLFEVNNIDIDNLPNKQRFFKEYFYYCLLYFHLDT